MKIVKLMGGLGNQMQQYALYEKYKALGEEVYLDVDWFQNKEVQQNALAPRKLELDYFKHVTYMQPTAEQKEQLLGSDTLFDKIKRRIFPFANKLFYETDMYHPELFTQKYEDVYLEGYWAAEKYYRDILPILRERFQFTSINEVNKQVQDRISQSEYPVSIHIRRGDYLDQQNFEMFGNICTEGYYQGAIDLVKKEHPEAEFFVFSDDMDYAKEKYSTQEYHHVDINHGKDSFYDIYLMSLCKANICANSTFSFWGARLNNLPAQSELQGIESYDKPMEVEAIQATDIDYKIMIRPSIHKNSQVYDAELMHDLWKDWILLNNRGEMV